MPVARLLKAVLVSVLYFPVISEGTQALASFSANIDTDIAVWAQSEATLSIASSSLQPSVFIT